MSATGKTAVAIRSAPARAASSAATSALPRGALAVEADGQAARLLDRAEQLVHAVRLERAGRVVEQHAGGAEVGQPARLLDERVLAGVPGL